MVRKPSSKNAGSYLLYKLFNNLSQHSKAAGFLVLDLVLIVVAHILSIMFQSSDVWPPSEIANASGMLLFWIIVAAVTARILRIHAMKLDSFDVSDVWRIGLWSLVVSGLGFLSNLVFGFQVPLSIPLIFGPLMFLLVFIAKFGLSHINLRMMDSNKSGVPVAVYGAGAGGVQLVAALKKSREYFPVLLVDDSKHLQGLTISGLRVRKPMTIERFLNESRIEKVILAIPSISPSKKQRILVYLADLGCQVQEIPSYVEIIQSGGVFRSLRSVQPEALLGRDNVDVNIPETRAIYSGVNVLISGGGGSIGSELCRKVLDFKPKKLVLLEISELALYTIEQELRPLAESLGVEYTAVIGSVGDSSFVTDVIKKNSIGVILHAAAYKHVPLLETNTVSAVCNNIFGTKVIGKAALDYGVKRFILISTDKAVRPTNVMGATKRFAELVIQNLQECSSSTVFSCVRFGNVLGSSGSVIPLFKRQIENGGPVTVTHSDVTRYFMTIPEATRLVLLAGAFAEGGDVFVLDMGEPIKIIDMARQMIELSGLSVRNETNPKGDIEIKINGLRPGEKLYEELLIGENTLSTPHPKILRAKEKQLTKAQIAKAMKLFEKAVAKNDDELIRKTLSEYVEGSQLSD